MEGKNEIRQRMRLLRRAMTSDERATSSKAICAKLLARDDVRQAIEKRQPIAVYLASPEEVDLTDFIVAALSRGASLLAPRWTGSLYELVPLTSLDNLVTGPHNILEPPPPSTLHLSPFTLHLPPSTLHPVLWLLPGLAFTKDGKRLGYGGGWYDRFLEKSDNKSVKIGVSFSFQVIDDLPIEAHDCLLTEVVQE